VVNQVDEFVDEAWPNQFDDTKEVRGAEWRRRRACLFCFSIDRVRGTRMSVSSDVGLVLVFS
jgi:hypothetical protein